jgi:hypothetical protein
MESLKLRAVLVRLVRGLEAGVVGGVAMQALLVAGALWRGQVWWAPANLLGSTFYGMRAFRSGPGMATLSGAAFHVVITGTVGALFGLVCGGVRERRRMLLLGTLGGIFWYYLADAFFWRHVNALVPAYAPQPVTLLSHVLYGACLGFMALGGAAGELRTLPGAADAAREDAADGPPASPVVVETEQDRVEMR